MTMFESVVIYQKTNVFLIHKENLHSSFNILQMHIDKQLTL